MAKFEGLGGDDITQMKLMYLIKLVIPINMPPFQKPIFSMVTADSLLIKLNHLVDFHTALLDELHSSKLFCR